MSGNGTEVVCLKSKLVQILDDHCSTETMSIAQRSQDNTLLGEQAWAAENQKFVRLETVVQPWVDPMKEISTKALYNLTACLVAKFWPNNFKQ